MILGWFKKRKMEKSELQDLRDFVRDVEPLLEAVDIMLDAPDEEPVLVTPKFLKWNRANGPMRVALPMPGPIDFPCPEAVAEVQAVRDYMHRETVVASRVYISEAEQMLCRSPSERAALVARVADKVNDQFREHFMRNEIP